MALSYLGLILKVILLRLILAHSRNPGSPFSNLTRVQK